MRKRPSYRVGAAALLLVGGLGTACSGDEAAGRPARQPAGYFDLNGLLATQTQRLQQQAPALEKQVQLRDAAAETKRVAKPDWPNELQLFYQADINKPALRGAYEVQTRDSAGLTRRTFRRRPAVDHPVLSLDVLQAGSVVRELQATIRQDNPLFFSGKQLRLRFGADGLLSSYQVLGRQKLVAFDTTRYAATARVLR